MNEIDREILQRMECEEDMLRERERVYAREREIEYNESFEDDEQPTEEPTR